MSHIAVAQIAKTGDMVLVTPLLRAIRGKYPQAWIFVVSGESGKRVLENSSDVDEVIVYQNDPFKLAQTLKAKKIDFAAITNPSSEMLAAFFLAGTSLISTFDLMPSERFHIPFNRSYCLLKHVAVLKAFYIGRYMPEQYLTLLEPIGIVNSDTHLRLSYSEKATLTVKKQLMECGIAPGNDFVVAIAPGGKYIRQWPAMRFARLANHLHEYYDAKFVLVGAGQDGDAISAVKEKLDKKIIYMNALDQSLDELKALIAHIDLLISNDSGPVTFAEAFDTPSVMIVGPTDEKEHHYEDKIHKMVVAPTREKPVTYARNWFNYDREEALRQIRAVTFEQVRDTVDALLENRGLKNRL